MFTFLGERQAQGGVNETPDVFFDCDVGFGEFWLFRTAQHFVHADSSHGKD